jgi:hypothetical protein
MDGLEDCPKCLGAIVIMEAKDTTGFEYNKCSLCHGEGKVPNEVAEDFIFSITEDNFNDNYE